MSLLAIRSLPKTIVADATRGSGPRATRCICGDRGLDPDLRPAVLEVPARLVKKALAAAPPRPGAARRRRRRRGGRRRGGGRRSARRSATSTPSGPHAGRRRRRRPQRAARRRPGPARGRRSPSSRPRPTPTSPPLASRSVDELRAEIARLSAAPPSRSSTGTLDDETQQRPDRGLHRQGRRDAGVERMSDSAHRRLRPRPVRGRPGRGHPRRGRGRAVPLRPQPRVQRASCATPSPTS